MSEDEGKLPLHDEAKARQKWRGQPGDRSDNAGEQDSPGEEAPPGAAIRPPD